MDPHVRVAAVAFAEAAPEVAATVWDAGPATVDLPAMDVGECTTAGGHRVERTASALLVDGGELGPVDLDLEELAVAAAVLLDDDIEALAAETTGEPARSRLRLLLEDCLFDPTNRAIAADRLTRLAARTHRRDRDVAGLFDA